jgi:hypothetical protein
MCFSCHFVSFYSGPPRLRFRGGVVPEDDGDDAGISSGFLGQQFVLLIVGVGKAGDLGLVCCRVRLILMVGVGGSVVGS